VAGRGAGVYVISVMDLLGGSPLSVRVDSIRRRLAIFLDPVAHLPRRGTISGSVRDLAGAPITGPKIAVSLLAIRRDGRSVLPAKASPISGEVTFPVRLPRSISTSERLLLVARFPGSEGAFAAESRPVVARAGA